MKTKGSKDLGQRARQKWNAKKLSKLSKLRAAGVKYSNLRGANLQRS